MSKKPDLLHHHEMIDRIHVINCNIEEHLLNHPVVEDNPELKKKIEEASEALGEAYQIAGREWFTHLEKVNKILLQHSTDINND